MRKLSMVIVMAALGMFLSGGSAFALTLDVGSPLLMIDGNGDTNTKVTLGNFNVTPSNYGLGYYLNNGSTFNDLGTGWGSIIWSLNGGDVVDLALYDDTDGNGVYDSSVDFLYTLSGDFSDDSYSVIMDFSGDIDVSNAEQPSTSELIAMGIDTYWQDVNINWSVTSGYTLSFALSTKNDGIAPVPEPGTLLLLGSGLMGVAAYARRRKA